MITDTPTLVRRRFTLVALVLPAIVSLVSLIVQGILLPQLPETIATHWAWNGTPDGVGPAWTMLLTTLLIGLGIPAAIFAMGRSGLRRGDYGAGYRSLGAVALSVAVLIGGLGVATLGIQLGRTDAAATLPPLLLPGVLLPALAAGIVGWMLQPHVPWQPTASSSSADVPVRPGERVVWLQGVSLARGGIVVLSIALMMGVAVGVPVVLLADPAASWVSLGVVVLLVMILVTTVRFHIRVDPDGLTAVSAVGWPRIHVPIADVAAAEVVEVSPMGEFGGWGIRWSSQGKGLVLRTGEGVRVQRRDGRTLTVTVDDAATAAGLLNAYAALTPGPQRD
ncbi:DUF1648 domain-containing protein [Microbacterium sp. MM2322]|uniref:DUF1648 domain-containing protein n=1 Tax=Microbacterium sp. MM2322 TaxID=3157631 RepID=UPI0032D58F4F